MNGYMDSFTSGLLHGANAACISACLSISLSWRKEGGKLVDVTGRKVAYGLKIEGHTGAGAGNGRGRSGCDAAYNSCNVACMRREIVPYA